MKKCATPLNMVAGGPRRTKLQEMTLDLHKYYRHILVITLAATWGKCGVVANKRLAK